MKKETFEKLKSNSITIYLEWLINRKEALVKWVVYFVLDEVDSVGHFFK